MCTIYVRNDPVATHEALIGFAPPKIGFLLPHGTWQEPPRPRSGPHAVRQLTHRGLRPLVPEAADQDPDLRG